MAAPAPPSEPGRRGVVGVCSWSLQPASRQDLVHKVRACGVEAVQLALCPYIGREHELHEVADALREQGIVLRSGMFAAQGEDYSSLASIRRSGGVRPDAHWRANRAAAEAVARLARAAGLELVTFHAGHVPPGRQGGERAKLLERLRTLADVFAGQGLRVGLETGQETAAAQLELLDDLARPGLGVNFDPANMLLYGSGEPVEALQLLAAHVVQVHVKDALPPPRRGQWGREVPMGEGAVDWPAFFQVLDAARPAADLMIEREGGERRVEDVRVAHLHVRSLLALSAGSDE